MVENNFWKKKKVFVTGHTGFKGSWISLWLSSMGSVVKGYALNPKLDPNLFNILNLDNSIESEINNIEDYETLARSIKNFAPEIIIHMAAQALVIDSYHNPLETYQTNVIGTANLLQAARQIDSVKSIVIVTSDKCYENDESGMPFKETHQMGGADPYSSSKGCTEILVSSFRRSFFDTNNIGVASARAGNVIGGGDWSNDRLIPDILKSLESNEPVLIRNPNSVRPWQHVIEPLSGYLVLAQQLYEEPYEFSEAWNFGPDEKDVKSVESILNYLNKLLPNLSWHLTENDNFKESNYLSLDISKALERLNWRPTWNLNEALRNIVHWQECWLNNNNMSDVCLKQITEFTSRQQK